MSESSRNNDNDGSDDPTPPQAPSTAMKRNAFDYLMSSHLKKATPTLPRPPSFPGRDALGTYLRTPSTIPGSVLITHNASFVTIRDKFPKAQIHLLILPRDATKSEQHPLIALSTDADFLRGVRAEAAAVTAVVAAELARRFGGAPEAWKAEVRVGVHARPSMRHLHVHVLSRDCYGTGMASGRHWMTFHSGFFVELGEFPLAEEDARWGRGWSKGVLAGELKCWRCGRGFGRQWKRLMEHLDGEVEEWKKEVVARGTSEGGVEVPEEASAGTTRGDDEEGEETE